MREQYLFSLLALQKATISTAESCTGGMIAMRLTELPGISEFFIEGLVTYSNESKIRRLNVNAATIEQQGAVSKATVEAMLDGLRTDARIAVSGIAGPGGGSAEKPVGTVWIGAAFKNRRAVKHFLFSGSRHAIRSQAADAAIELLIELCNCNDTKTLQG